MHVVRVEEQELRIDHVSGEQGYLDQACVRANDATAVGGSPRTRYLTLREQIRAELAGRFTGHAGRYPDKETSGRSPATARELTQRRSFLKK